MRKNWRGEGKIFIEKWYDRWLRLPNMLFPGRIYIAPGPWRLEDFCNIFLPNISEDQKSPTIWVRGPGTVPHGKYGAGYCICLQKV